MIIATAGHVDHGKTELIRSLTGIDTDRLPEEKARGLSIDLGFAYQSLTDNTILGFVDVPGHEKFIRNMLAGVAGIDLGLLVVAADDGVMPQTREHLAILDLLGIDQCIAAITKIDRVQDHRVLEVRQQVGELLRNTGRKETAVYPLCAPDNQGVDALRNALAQQAQAVSKRSIDGHFRLAIDRVFTLKGVGLVVTGMVFSGTANIGDNLLLSADGTSIRVRGIRAQNEESDCASAGERCAINIVGRGIREGTLRRGSWLLHPHLHRPTRRIDVDLRVLDTESRSLKHWTPTHLHLGADHLSARVAILTAGNIDAGEHGLAQLVLKQDAFVVHGDRFVLRDQSAQRTIAGGQVIDPYAPKRGRSRPSRIATLQAMNQDNPMDGLAAQTRISEVGVSLSEFSVAHNLTARQTDAMVESLALKRTGHHPEARVFSESQWQNLLKRIETTVENFHQDQPKRPGASIRDIQLALRPFIDTTVLDEATLQLSRENRFADQGKRFHLPSHVIEVSARDRQLWAHAMDSLAPDSGSPLSLHQAAEATGVDVRTLENSLKQAVKIGEMICITKNRYIPTFYLTRLGSAAEVLAKTSAEGNFTVVGYCEHTGVGRNFAIDLLEHFDRLGFTRRTGNNRRIERAAVTVFTDLDES